MKILIRKNILSSLLTLIAFSIVLLPSRPLNALQSRTHTLGSTYIAYYGKAFYEELNKGSRNQQLKGLLRVIMKSYHQKIANNYDEITIGSCAGKPGCYRHKVLGYDAARIFLMGYFNLVKTPDGFGVREVYCNRVYTQREFPSEPPGPQRIPNGTIVNTEHTWPQSRFSPRNNTEEQKSDIHHLYPTDSQMNAKRSSFEFGVVSGPSEPMPCPTGKLGRSSLGRGLVFEPPQGHKGNVARALLYFSTRYELKISSAEETTLKLWNKQDPVDNEEAQRNEAIYQIQGTRNPFIDYPDLADRITDF